jgi:adenine C2-methylase RlmN of 23S rRNA A2503 and tRNA A37
MLHKYVKAIKYAAVVVTVVIVYLYGYKAGTNEQKVVQEALVQEAVEEGMEQLKVVQTKLSNTELQLMEEVLEVEIVYVPRVKEVIKYVSTKGIDRSSCTLTDSGLLKLSDLYK